MNRVRQQLVIMAIATWGLLPAMAQSTRAPSTPDLATIVQRVEQAQVDLHEVTRPYQVTREYRFYQGEEKPQPDSNIIAEVTYEPPDDKQFTITDTQGGGRGQHVVKKVLEHEKEMAGRWEQAAVSGENYKFSFLGEETLNGRRCFILGLEPRRDSKELIKGRAWIDAGSYRIRQIQGEPSKSPSFWIKKLNVTLSFSDVEGMWLQTAIRAVADVRLFGRNILAERDLSYRVSVQSAAKKSSRRSHPENTIAIFVR